MNDEHSPEKRFVVDSMLGKVAKWLRILGFDASCVRFENRGQIETYTGKGFIPLTRNRKWCSLAGVVCLSGNTPAEQLRELVAAVSIGSHELCPLHRCIICNQPLESIPRNQAFGSVPDYVFETSASFFRCPSCKRIYWPGSHPKRMMERIGFILGKRDH